MSKKTPWIFVDCEARGTSPVHGVLTESGAVHYDTRDTFHGRLFEATPDPENPAISLVGERIATDVGRLTACSLTGDGTPRAGMSRAQVPHMAASLVTVAQLRAVPATWSVFRWPILTSAAARSLRP